jgi:hypothetical protein
MTTSERTTTFPNGSPTRRGFLSNAAVGVAAGGTVAALAILPPPATAAAAQPLFSLPAMAPDDWASFPALRAAGRALLDASEALTAAEAAFKVEDDRAVEWQKQNPPPRGDKRAMSRWLRLARKSCESSDMQSAWDTQIAAEEAFQAAQMEVAKVEPQDLRELMLKAYLVLIFEEPEGLKMAWSRNNSHVIGRSVAINLAAMSQQVQS